MFAKPPQKLPPSECRTDGESGSGIRKSYHFLSFSRTLRTSRLDDAAAADAGDAYALGYYLPTRTGANQTWSTLSNHHHHSPRQKCVPIYTVHFRQLDISRQDRISWILTPSITASNSSRKNESVTVTPIPPRNLMFSTLLAGLEPDKGACIVGIFGTVSQSHRLRQCLQNVLTYLLSISDRRGILKLIPGGSLLSPSSSLPVPVPRF